MINIDQEIVLLYDNGLKLDQIHEETGFEIVSKFITAEKSYIIRHKSRDETEKFVIHTSQRFPRYTKTRVLNRETCDLHYFKVAEFKKLVAFRSPIFKRYVINSAAQSKVLTSRVIHENTNCHAITAS